MKKILPSIVIAVFTTLAPLSANKPLDASTCIMNKNMFSMMEMESFKFAPINPEDENKFTLYITDGILYIKYSKPQELVNGEAVVYNLLGKEIARKKLENTNINEISVPMQNTCYIVRLNYAGKVYTQKVIPSSN